MNALDDTTLERSVNEITDLLDQPHPPPDLDRRVLRHARSLRRRALLAAPQLVWPASAAAALLISIGVLSHVWPFLPEPGHPQIDLSDGRGTVPPYEPLPPPAPVGTEIGIDAGVSGSVEFRSDVPAGVDQAGLQEAAETRARLAGEDPGPALMRLEDAVRRGADEEILRRAASLHLRWPELDPGPELAAAIDAARTRVTARDLASAAADGDNR